jgi:hypothetical protein
MAVAEVLTEFGRRHVLATAEGDRLRVRGQAGEVAAVRDVVIAHKADLLAALADVCGGCSQGMTPVPLAAEGCGWPGCRHKGMKS